MLKDLRLKLIIQSIILTLITSIIAAEDEEIYLKAISDQIQVITKDLKTLDLVNRST